MALKLPKIFLRYIPTQNALESRREAVKAKKLAFYNNYNI